MRWRWFVRSSLVLAVALLSTWATPAWAKTCDSDVVCDTGERCVEGNCLPVGTCFGDGDCQSGETCYFGGCVPACSTSDDCMTPNVCVQGACVPPDSEPALKDSSGCAVSAGAQSTGSAGSALLLGGSLALLALVAGRRGRRGRRAPDRRR